MRSDSPRQTVLLRVALATCLLSLPPYSGAAYAQASPPPTLSPGAQNSAGSASEDDLRDSAPPSFNFSVPPGPLARVLGDIAAQSGSRYSTDTSVTASRSPGISGRYTLHEAVARALIGTGWQVVSVRGGYIRLQRVIASSGITTLDTVVVTARRQTFEENFSSIATNTETPLRETPATIDAVTEDILQSQNAFTTADAVRNLPGVLYESSGAPNQIVVGPDSSAGVTFTNGLRNGDLASDEPAFLMDSIEILKGPASLLTGTQVGGGLLNYVPKQADGIKPAEVSLGTGNDGELLATGDFSGAVERLDHLYYRVLGFAQHADQDPAGGNNPYQYVISPMLGYRSDDTTFDLAVQHFTQRTPFARLDYLDTDGNVHSYGSIYNPDTTITTDFTQGNYDFSQTLLASPGWTMNLRARGLYQSGNNTVSAAVPAAIIGPAFLVVSLAEYEPQHTDSQYIDLYNKFRTGPLEHQLIVAGSMSLIEQSRAVNAAGGVVFAGGTTTLPPVPYSGPQSAEHQNQYGLIVQDQMTSGRLHALLGGRESWYHDNLLPASGPPSIVSNARKLTPNVGFVFDLSKVVSVYASFNQAFTPEPSSVQTVSGAVLPPQLETRYELGVKSGLLDDRLSVNGSAFAYTTNNAALVDPQNPLFYIPGPGQKAQGIEVSAAGSITPSLNVTAGYTYSNATLTGGGPVYDEPHNVANLWLIKTLTLANEGRLQFGLGGNYSGRYWLDEGSTQTLVRFGRASVSVNGSLGYAIRNYRINLVVDNILDRNNYALSSSTYQLQRAEPTTFSLVVSASLP